MAVHGPINVTTTGSAGSATGDTTTGFDFDVELIEAIKVTYDGSAPATTDVTISETEGLQRDLLTLTDNNTSGTYYPRHTTHDATGTDSSGSDLYVVEGPIKVAVAGCDAITDAVSVTIQTVYNRDMN